MDRNLGDMDICDTLSGHEVARYQHLRRAPRRKLVPEQ
jgi:hypothetical protein